MQNLIHKLCLLICLSCANNLVLGQLTLRIHITNISLESYSGQELLYNGSITVMASGGTPPYTYSIANRSVNNNGYFPGLWPATDTVVVTDATGQTKSISGTIGFIFPQPTLGSADIVVPTAPDSANGSFTLIGSGGTPPYTYSIDGGNSFSENNIFTNLTEGSYRILLKDSNNQLAEISTNPTFNNLPGFLNLICYSCPLQYNFYDPDFASWSCTNEGYLELMIGMATSPIKFSLDNINYCSMIKNPFLKNTYFYDSSYIPPGFYHLYLKYDSSGDNSIFSFSISRYCNIQISYIEVDASCQQSDGSLTVSALNGVPPYTYTLDGVNYQVSNVFSGLQSGTYTIGIKDASGVTNYSTAVVFNKCPVLSAKGFADSCSLNKGSIKVSGIKGTKPYFFSINGSGFQTDSIFTGLNAGNYTVVLKDSNGFKDSTTVTLNNYCLQIYATASNTTCGSKNGSITVIGSGGILPYQYAINNSNFQSNNIFSELDTGKFTIAIQDSSMETDTMSIYINNISGPVITTVTLDTASCINTGGGISVEISGGTSPFQYGFNGQNYQNNNQFKVDTSGTYIIRVKDTNGCINTDTVQLPRYPTPVIVLGNDTTLCTGQSLFLNAGDNFITYEWSNGASSTAITVTATGTYMLTATDFHNCTVTDSIRVTYLQTPIFTLGNDTSVCQHQILKLQTSVQGSYLWQDGTTLNHITVNSPGIYWLQLNNGKCFYRDTITISYIPLPVLQLPADTILCNQSALLLNAKQTGKAASYQWQDGSANPEYLITTAGTYSVTVIQNGCSNSDTCVVDYQDTPVQKVTSDTSKCKGYQLSFDVSFPNASYEWQDLTSSSFYTVTNAGLYYCNVSNYCGMVIDTFNVTDIICECLPVIPNAFSPNGDGINDEFRPLINCTPSYYHMLVFDRDGQKVFESFNVSDNWNGTYQNKLLPVGTYYYILKLAGISDPVMRQKSGSITLLR